MIERALVPVDGSEQGEAAVKFVTEEFPAATMVLLHVIDPAQEATSLSASLPSYSEQWFEREKAEAADLFEEMAALASEAGVETESETVVGKPADAIVEVAGDEERDINHVVMGSHGREGVSRLILGSVAETVMRRSPVPVTVVR